MKERTLRIGKYLLHEEDLAPVASLLYLTRTYSNEAKEDNKQREVVVRVELSVEENIALEKLLDKFFQKAIKEIKGKLTGVEEI